MTFFLYVKKKKLNEGYGYAPLHTYIAKLGLPSSSSGDRDFFARGGLRTVGMNGDRERDRERRLLLCRGGEGEREWERESERDLERSVDGDLVIFPHNT